MRSYFSFTSLKKSLPKLSDVLQSVQPALQNSYPEAILESPFTIILEILWPYFHDESEIFLFLNLLHPFGGASEK